MSDQETPSGTLTYTRNDSIALPQSAAENRFAIRMSDWQRLKRSIGKCKTGASPGLSGWYFCCFGVAASAIVSIIPLTIATGVQPWVVPTYWCVTIFATVLGIVLVVIDRRLGREKQDRLEELGIDMKEIESGFGSMQ